MDDTLFSIIIWGAELNRIAHERGQQLAAATKEIERLKEVNAALEAELAALKAAHG